MDFSYRGSFEADNPSAYATLLLDCLEGDRMLFAQGDWVEAAWALLDPLLNAWGQKAAKDFPNYAAGTWGPKEAQTLIERSGQRWHLR
jgi:glucose-6-phosphate 1-dehydrogenase